MGAVPESSPRNQARAGGEACAGCEGPGSDQRPAADPGPAAGTGRRATLDSSALNSSALDSAVPARARRHAALDSPDQVRLA